MSERIRSLERAYRASGEAEDLLAWLRARQRADLLGGEVEPWLEALASGEVEPEQIELAAYLGDPLARLLDEERAVSLATYFGEGFELVPLVLGEASEDEEALRRWIFSLGKWNESWVVEAQLVIASGCLRLAESAEPYAPNRGDLEPWEVEEAIWELESRERAQAEWGRILEAAWACFGSLSEASLAALDSCGLYQGERTLGIVASAAQYLTLRWGQGKPLWAGDLEFGAQPERVAGWVRAGLLPKILQVL